MFGKLLGHTSPAPVTYTSTVLAGQIEVAMVLDNSGSMAQTVSGDSQNKITLVQSAANSFASSLTSLQNGNVRIAVVPFTSTVNVGLTQANAPSWIDPLASYIYTKDPLTGAATTNALTTSPSTTTFSDVFTGRSRRELGDKSVHAVHEVSLCLFEQSSLGWLRRDATAALQRQRLRNGMTCWTQRQMPAFRVHSSCRCSHPLRH